MACDPTRTADVAAVVMQEGEQDIKSGGVVCRRAWLKGDVV